MLDAARDITELMLLEPRQHVHLCELFDPLSGRGSLLLSSMGLLYPRLGIAEHRLRRPQ